MKIRYSSTALDLVTSGRTPGADFMSTPTIKQPWINVALPGENVDVLVFEDGTLETRLTLRLRSDANAHMTVEQARALRDSLTLALAKADEAAVETLLEQERRLAS